MKRYPKIVQADARGQIVIPKDIRAEIDMEEGTGFYVYAIGDEGILLKRIPAKELSHDDPSVAELKQKAEKIGMSPKKLDKAVEGYRKTKSGRLDLV